MNDSQVDFNIVVMVAADSSDKLRATDVGRLMVQAFDMKCFPEFKAWLLKQPLQDRTRAEIEQFEEIDCL